MKIGFYLKMAAEGIRKNKKFYVPFLLTSSCMTAIYYIVTFLSVNPALKEMPGGDSMQMILTMGKGVMAVFSGIFLFYTHSFLMRRRKKELGLYCILGMGKASIGRILVWETVLAVLITMVSGIGVGIALSKLAELALLNMIQGKVGYVFLVSWTGISECAVVFSVIFLLLLLRSLGQIHLSNPVALLRSENVGEKPPKANWFLGLMGAVLLGVAYYLAVTIQEPLTAILAFFAAVILVIVATYLLFIAGSVLLCRLLQKNKKYYYQARHFVSVSSMAYRMKRNGASLASVCILGTMVLVMISSSACLYFGAEDSLRSRYPRGLTAHAEFNELGSLADEKIAALRGGLQQCASEAGIQPQNILDYRYVTVTGYLSEGILETDVQAVNDFQMDTYDSVYQVYFIPLSDYNRMMGAEETLEKDQALVYAYRGSYGQDHLTIQGSKTFQIKKVLDTFMDNGLTAMDIISSIMIVVPDLEDSTAKLMELTDYLGYPIAHIRWLYGFDAGIEPENQIALADQMKEKLMQMARDQSSDLYMTDVDCLEEQRADFYGTYGGLFFLGIMLSIVFLLATVLIIYYKQISEGYEDQPRFEIMQKVGMTQQDIRKSIHSQMLTVFMLPLIMAAVHLGFAFPIIRKLLLLFNLTNLPLLLLTNAISILVFALFYITVYRVTARTYCTIVSGNP